MNQISLPVAVPRLPRGAIESVVAVLATLALVAGWIDVWVLGAPLL